MINLLIIGAPGAGKGTQAQHIATKYSIPAISTGDIFRASVKNKTELGQEASKYIDAGNLVPDEVTNKMVHERLGEDDTKNGFLLDGYPRNTSQASELDSMLKAYNKTLDGVIYLEVDNEELIQRLLERAKIEGRKDDTEDVIRHRLDVYDQETKPLIGLYKDDGLLIHVDGLGQVDDVTDRISAAIDKKMDKSASK